MTAYPVDETGSPQAMLAEAMTLYTMAAEVMAMVIEEARLGDRGAAKEAAGYAREYRQALQTVLQERATIEKLRRQEEGAVNGYALDLAAARDEIGRRLACLRDAGDG